MDFSVLMPVHKKDEPAAFRAAADSIFQQTFPPAEVVLVKDGPLPPGLEEMVAETQKKYGSALHLVALPENTGLPGVLNAGLRHCSAEWVARMDSDDISLPHRFEAQFEYLKQCKDVDVLSAWIEDRDPKMEHILGVRKVPERQEAILRFAAWRNPVNHMAVIYRKSVVLDQGGYPEHLRGFEDYGLWIKLLKGGCRFANVPEVLIRARAGDGLLERRRGRAYFLNELKFFDFGLKIGFFSFFQYSLLVSSRAFLRLLPRHWLKWIYFMLRSKQ